MSEKVTAVTVSGAPLILDRGVLELSPDLSTPRAHALKPIGQGRFEIRGEVHFKAGQRLGWVGEIPKRLAHVLQPVRRSKPVAGMSAAMSGAGGVIPPATD